MGSPKVSLRSNCSSSIQRPAVEDEVFCDDWGTYWLPKSRYSRNEARHAISQLDGARYVDVRCRSVQVNIETHPVEGRVLRVHQDGEHAYWELETEG